MFRKAFIWPLIALMLTSAMGCATIKSSSKSDERQSSSTYEKNIPSDFINNLLSGTAALAFILIVLEANSKAPKQ
jgi:hypothetical protein